MAQLLQGIYFDLVLIFGVTISLLEVIISIEIHLNSNFEKLSISIIKLEL